MAGVHFIRHGNIEILHINFSNTSSKGEILEIMDETKGLIATRPLSSVLVLTDITGAFFDRDISQAMKQLAAHNKPYVRASAVVGVTPIRRIVYNAVMFFSGRHFESCDDLESAKAWLLSQC